MSTKEYAWINGEKSSYENWNPDDPDYKEDSCVRLKQRAQYKFADWDCLGEYFYLCTSKYQRQFRPFDQKCKLLPH